MFAYFCLGTGPVKDDKEETGVRLIQFTPQGYLNSRCEIFRNPSVLTADACRALRNFDLIKDLSSVLDSALQKYPLRE